MKELIFKYLDRNFNIILDGSIKIVDKNLGQKDSYQLKQEIFKIFHILDDRNEYEKLVDKWFDEKTEFFVGGLRTFLNECVIVQGSTNWEVKHRLYGTIDIFKINHLPYDSPLKKHEEALNKIIDEWYSNEVIKVSEINMKRIWNYQY